MRMTIILLISSSELPEDINSYWYSMEEGQTITIVREEDDFWRMSIYAGEEKNTDDIRFKFNGDNLILEAPDGERLVEEGVKSKFIFRNLSYGETQILIIEGSTQRYIGNYKILENRIEMIFEGMTPQKLNVYFK